MRNHFAETFNEMDHCVFSGKMRSRRYLECRQEKWSERRGQEKENTAAVFTY